MAMKIARAAWRYKREAIPLIPKLIAQAAPAVSAATRARVSAFPFSAWFLLPFSYNPDRLQRRWLIKSALF
jgi:hypothetical protein